MMGPKQQIEPKLFYTGLCLDQRIRPDHPLRAIAAAIDFDFVRAEVAPLYGTRGNRSVDPAVLLKLMFLSFYENVRSERALAGQLPERLDWMWFCGYDLDDELPTHSVLSKARRRWGPQAFDAFFQHVLEQCVAAGLVEGRLLLIDASLIHADADRDTLQPVLRHVSEQLYSDLEQTAEPLEPDRYSPTDPDARLVSKNGQSVLGYKDHRAVDDAHGIITATVTTDAATAEAHVAGAVLDQHQARLGSQPEAVAADKGYGKGEVYQDLAARGITPCIPHQQQRGRHAVGVFGPERFGYDADRDAYRCPNDQWLERYAVEADGARRYAAGPGVCRECPLRARCTRDSRRRLRRAAHQELVDWADGCFSREHRQRLMRRRKIRAEGSFADAANLHGYKRARWRGQLRVEMQNLLIAAVQNVRKLVRALRRRAAGALRAAQSLLGGLAAVRAASVAALRAAVGCVAGCRPPARHLHTRRPAFVRVG